MKKILILFIVAISLSLTAQDKPFQFGIKAGPNFGWFSASADNYSNSGIHFGGSWGFIADFHIMENYSFVTGFDVLYLNGTLSYPDVYSDTIIGSNKRNYRTQYVKIPLLFTMKTNEINGMKFYGQVGFGFSILFAAKAKDDFTGDNGEYFVTPKHNIYDEMLPTRESLILGGGVEIPLQGSTIIRIGITYDNAIANILRGYNRVDTSNKNNGRNNFIALDIGVLF